MHEKTFLALFTPPTLRRPSLCHFFPWKQHLKGRLRKRRNISLGVRDFQGKGTFLFLKKGDRECAQKYKTRNKTTEKTKVTILNSKHFILIRINIVLFILGHILPRSRVTFLTDKKAEFGFKEKPCHFWAACKIECVYIFMDLLSCFRIKQEELSV